MAVTICVFGRRNRVPANWPQKPSQLPGSMPNDPRDRAPTDDPPYKVYRSPPTSGPRESDSEERPYNLYRSLPRGLRSRLRGEEESAELDADRPGRRFGGRFRRGSGGGSGGPGDQEGVPWWRRRVTLRRALKWLAVAIVAWLLLSVVLFLVSAQIQSGTIPQSAQNALHSGSNMVTGADTVLVLGTDQRPKGSHEPGANTSDKGSRSDSIMLWRIGGGTSRRLSIPRDTVADIPGVGQSKINAGYAYGGPALEIKTIEKFTGIPINHLIIVNLANFPKFIDAIGGVDVKTGRICSNISGGTKNGGFSLFLRPGVHHLTGIQALTLARTRENACNASSNDLTRAGYQQKILNGIKSRLLSPGIFFHLPWASWAAPKAVRTDMGGFTLLSLFLASEIGGSAPTDVLKPTGSTVLPGGGDALVATPGEIHRAVNKLLNG
jgi:LCP family protein required for cell wall assembly